MHYFYREMNFRETEMPTLYETFQREQLQVRLGLSPVWPVGILVVTEGVVQAWRDLTDVWERALQNLK